jgi:hypothetical protein
MQAVAQSHERTPREKLLGLEREINGRVFEREEAVGRDKAEGIAL